MWTDRTKEGLMVNCVEPQHCHVALLAGGSSGEREVSIASGVGAREALESVGFSVTVLDPADKDDLKELIDGPYDIAFICLHGKLGEDGTLQGMLEMLGIPYIGSGVWSSALAMDKTKTKMFYERHHIPTPPSLTLKTSDEADTDTIVEQLGLHCVVKPATEGSALGVFIVHSKEDIAHAIQEARKYDSDVLIERYIKGKELTVAVIGNDQPEALPIIEIVSVNDFYDYEAKYVPGASRHVCPAPLLASTTRLIQDYAVSAHKALECAGVSRSDFILEDDGTCWILETNTIPGMTSTSLLPDAARAAGISFPELCTKLIQYALE